MEEFDFSTLKISEEPVQPVGDTVEPFDFSTLKMSEPIPRVPTIQEPVQEQVGRVSEPTIEPQINEESLSRGLATNGVDQSFFGTLKEETSKALGLEAFARAGEEMKTAERLGQEGTIGGLEEKTHKVLSGIGSVLDATFGTVGRGILGTAKLLTPESLENTIKEKGTDFLAGLIEEGDSQDTPVFKQTGKTTNEHLGELVNWWDEQPEENKLRYKSLGRAIELLPFAKSAKKLATEAFEVGTEQAVKAFSKVKSIELPKLRKKVGTERISDELTISEKFFGIDKATKKRLTGKKELGDEYRKVVEQSSKSDLSDTPMEYLSNKYQREVLDVFETKKKELGARIGKDKTLGFEVDQAEIDTIENSVHKYLSSKNIKIKDGKLVQGTGQVLLDGEEKKNVLSVLNRIKRLRQNPKSKDLLEFRDAVTDDISKFKSSTGISTSGLDELNQVVRGKIRNINRTRLGAEKSKILEQFSLLKQITDPKVKSYSSDKIRKFVEIIKNENIEFPMARIISDRSRLPKTVLKDIGDATGIDLLDYTLDNATMMKVMTDLYGTQRMKSLFKQGIGDAMKTGATGLATGGKGLVLPALSWFTKKFVNPEKVLQKILNTPTSQSFKRNMALFAEKKIDLKEFRKSISSFEKELITAKTTRNEKAIDEALANLATLKKTNADMIVRTEKIAKLKAKRRAVKDLAEKQRIDKLIQDETDRLNRLALPEPKDGFTADVSDVKPIRVRGEGEEIPKFLEHGKKKDLQKAPKSDIVGDMETEAKKYKSAEEFLESIGEDLFILNKEAKKFKSSFGGTREKYELKNKILKLLGEDTGEFHKFSGGGIGRLYRVGNDTFHDIMTLPEYNIITNKKLSNFINKSTKDVLLEKNESIVYDVRQFDSDFGLYKKENNIFTKIRLDKRVTEELNKIIKTLPQNIKDINLKTVTPPTKNTRGEFTPGIEKRLKTILDLKLNKKQLKDLWNKANKK